MARLSGAQRRKLKRSPSLFTRQQVEQHLAVELDAHRVALANQRARVRGARLAPPDTQRDDDKRDQARATETQADVLLAHLGEVL